MPRPLVIKALRDAIAQAFPPPVRVATEIPGSLDGKVVVIERFGGPDSTRMDYPRVDVDAFAPTLIEAYELAEDVRTFFRFQLVGQTIGGFTINEVRTSSGPSRAPYSNTGTRRVTASYSLAVHH